MHTLYSIPKHASERLAKPQRLAAVHRDTLVRLGTDRCRTDRYRVLRPLACPLWQTVHHITQHHGEGQTVRILTGNEAPEPVIQIFANEPS
jgi:hypothetical protein